mgnify:CR=1 FL=1
MKYKYAVFDWDGTLADTYPVISAAYDYTFDKMGLLRIPYDEIKRITSTLQNKDTLGYVFKERRQGIFTNISKNSTPTGWRRCSARKSCSVSAAKKGLNVI